MKPITGSNFSPQIGVAALVFASPGPELAFLEALFADCHWHMDAVSSVKEGIRCIRKASPRLVICDDRLEDGDWRSILDVTTKERLPPRMIVTSRIVDERLWAEVLNLGGYSLLAKPYDATEVIRMVGTAWGSRVLEAEPSSVQSAVSGHEAALCAVCTPATNEARSAASSYWG